MENEGKTQKQKKILKEIKNRERRRRSAEQFLQVQLWTVKMSPERQRRQTGEDPALNGKAQEGHLPELRNCYTKLLPPSCCLTLACFFGL